ncbi:MAG: chemotaxis protein CheW [Zoogloeaceae bacterium]|jgi:twitching motility protein PilI|nr:chemotaxis protein CheW [Zoogloeaceae bacterium]
MARRTSLREFQQYLNDRLSSQVEGEQGSSLLCVEAGGRRWLMDLADAGEIVSPPLLVSIPLAQPFFIGLANIRGNLYAVTDFSLFTGGTPILASAPGAKLLLVGVKQGSNAALLVHRILGLRKLADFTAGEAAENAPSWEVGVLIDPDGQEWRRVDLKTLLSDSTFMNIAA